MKKSSIILLIVIAAAIAIIISMAGDFSTYQTFTTAAKKPNTEFHVIGVLEKNMPMNYNPQKDANSFTFYAKDKSGAVKKVIFTGTKPTDFERSEQIVLVGNMAGSEFHCSQILMKCPSKYKNDQVAMGNNSSSAAYNK